jgi:hypothetical protein
VQEEDGEAEEDDLRGHVETAAPAQEPEARVAEGRPDADRVDSFARQLAHDDRADGGGREAEPAEEHERGSDARRFRERGQHQRADQSSHRHRRLSDPERQTALRRREPLHHRAAAGGLDARACGARERDQHSGGDSVPRCRRCRDAGAARREPDPERAPFTDAVGNETPRKQAERQADPFGGEQEPHALQAEVVGLPQGRSDRRQPERDRREARLRRRSRGEDGPAVPAAPYRPNGLNGFGLVETSTLFVSR